MKIWAKLITNGKIKKQIVYERDEKLVYSQFFDYLTDMCQKLDIPTPVLLKTHIFNFAKFNHVKFFGGQVCKHAVMVSSSGIQVQSNISN